MKKTRIANKVAEDAMNRLDELAILCYYDTDFNPVFDKQMYGQLIVKECAWLVRQEILRQEILKIFNDLTSYTLEVLLEEKLKKHFGINDL